ncbi:MAG: cell wall-binding repeat-containing protein [Actinobacteria bacterium]|nr:cell wall-binding repeat-containing protein [Actinomycetota bacterium]
MRRALLGFLGVLVASVLVPTSQAGAEHVTVPIQRIAGADRITTAVEVARLVHETATTAVLARADTFADALAGAPLAAQLDGPLLLTASDHVPNVVRAELDRLQVRSVVLLGGPAAIEPAVEEDLGRDREISRFEGRDRYGTAAAVSGALDSASTVFVTTGANFPDALSVGPLASRRGSPILLTEQGTLPAVTRRAIERVGPQEIIVVGGPHAVSEHVMSELEATGASVHRIAGPTRFDTAAALYDASVAAGMDRSSVWLATAHDHPDALAAGPAIARLGQTLLLVDGRDLGEARVVVDRLQALGQDLRHVRILGGPDAVTGDAPRQLDVVLHDNLLPRGGTQVFARQRLVGFYGNADSTAMGVLGETDPDEAARRLSAQAAPYGTDGTRVLPSFELIVQVATKGPGPDGDYSAPGDLEDIERYLQAARRHGLYLFLDIQPGRSDFPSQVRRYERFLREPDVGLALDPEWRMGPNEVPGETIGSVHADEVNEVGRWLAAIVREERLPQKLFVIHQFRADMIEERHRIEHPPELALTFHIDGFGTQRAKLGTYGRLAITDGSAHNGFKLFYDEDTDLFEPSEVLRIRPIAELITYQ